MPDHEKEGESPATRKRIEEHLKRHPALKDRIIRQILYCLHVPSIAGGKRVHVDMDGEKEQALGFLR